MYKRKKPKIITGILKKNRRGFGFVISEEIEKDIFIPPSGMGSGMNGDTVKVEIGLGYARGESPEGMIKGIVRRNSCEIVGTFVRGKKYGFVIPQSKKDTEDIFIPKKFFSGAKQGDKVVVKITDYPDRFNSAEGKITEIIAKASQPGGDIKAIARSHGMRDTFPSRVAAEAKAIGKISISDEEIRNRRDLRDETIFTIDGRDSKDFDDAVSIRILENGNYLLGVHIADVSHYVKDGTRLDKEALERGTSVYLLNYVIPMLPKDLSNGICSLNPGEDRLTLSVDMEISSDGIIVEHEIYESIIKSKRRFVYDDVSDLLDGVENTISKENEEIKEALFTMAELAKILNRKREERGSIDFDIAEAEINLDSKGFATDVELIERGCANRLIEEFMLLANETVAEHFFWMDMPFVYRVHEKPEIDKIEHLKVFLNGLGITLKGNSESIHPKALQDVLKRAQGNSNESVINTVTLRSMQKAFYSTVCQGHFGLALRFYCHFTSPIRRYPDLMIHRIIKKCISGQLDDKSIKKLKNKSEIVAELSSESERKALEVEREVDKYKKAEYMSKHIGEKHIGTISGIKEYGIYIQLKNTVEGLIPIDEIEGVRQYRLGDQMEIVVDYVDLQRSEINFIPA